jgi:hypothetical protein
MTKNEQFDKFKYAAGAHRKDEKRRGRLNLELNEFITSVDAEKHILQHTAARQKEVASPKNGSKQIHHPFPADELELHRRAVKHAIDDARLPPRSRRPHEGLTCSDEVVSPEDNPLNTLIDAEEAENRAALVHKAMKSVVKDGTDMAILRLLYFGSDTVNQAQVARKLGISPSCLSKRLSAIQEALMEFIQREGTFS